MILGGYDENRFEPNNMSFPFDASEEQQTSLKLQRITAERTFNGSVVLLQEEIYVNLDFTMPYLWLPGDICDHIASHFRLRYDNATELYVVDDETHTDLVARNPSFTFSFGNSAGLGDTVNIDLSYAALDLQASWPIYNETKNYFPIRRAANASQYTIGRALMQEAYVIVDYERRNFSLHQAAFPAPNAQKIVAISARDGQIHEKEDSLSKGSIAGIATGSVIFAALLVTLITLLVRRRWLLTKSQSMSSVEEVSISEKKEETSELAEASAKREQLMSSEVLELQWSNEVEIDGKARCELA